MTAIDLEHNKHNKNRSFCVKRMLAAFAALLCLMPAMAQVVDRPSTEVNVTGQQAKITQTSTLYLGEVVLNGQQSFYYLYSADLTNFETVFAAVKDGLSDFKGGIYKALVPDIVGESEDKGIAVCSNADYTAMMNADWISAANAGQACLNLTDVAASSSDDLYETDADFAAKCSEGIDEDGVDYVDNDGNEWTFRGILGKLSATNTDNITYTVENGKLIKHIDRHIDYTCESVTVIYTKAEFDTYLAGDANGDGKVDVADIVEIVNFLQGQKSERFNEKNADADKNNEVNIQDINVLVDIIMGKNVDSNSAITNPALGQVIGSDGKNYNKDEVPEGVTAVATIVYLGSDNGEAAPYNHGLALALKDAGGVDGYYRWNKSKNNAGHTKQTDSSNFTYESGLQYNATHNTYDFPAFKAAINYSTAAPTGCSAWFLASGYQWTKMFAGNANGLKKLAGLTQSNYWSSSESNADEAWYFRSHDGGWNDGDNVIVCHVRSCLAF